MTLVRKAESAVSDQRFVLEITRAESRRTVWCLEKLGRTVLEEEVERCGLVGTRHDGESERLRLRDAEGHRIYGAHVFAEQPARGKADVSIVAKGEIDT